MGEYVSKLMSNEVGVSDGEPGVVCRLHNTPLKVGCMRMTLIGFVRRITTCAACMPTQALSLLRKIKFLGFH